MIIARVSPLTGKLNTMDLPVTQDQLDLYATGTVLLQRAFPALAPSQREFIKTGYTPADWDALFGAGTSERNDLSARAHIEREATDSATDEGQTTL